MSTETSAEWPTATNAARPQPSAWAALRRFAQPPPQLERCELCSVELPPEHEHLVEPEGRQLLCACQACALLFDTPVENRYRRVPRDGCWLSDFRISDAQWESLGIPIGLAFFFHSSPIEKLVAIYPSPAGPTESLLELDAWQGIAEKNSVLQQLAPDTEALLVNRIGGQRQYFQTPIDQCYQLIGLIRTHWQGFSGGTEAWNEVARFLDRLKERSRRR